MVKRAWIRKCMFGLFCVGLFMGSGSEPAVACGTLDDQIREYWRTGISKPQVLRQIADMCDQFSANHSEEPLMAVFVDAVTQDIDRTLVRTSFEAFWCLGGLIGKDGYGAIRAALPGANCPTEADVGDWYMVSVDAANIRSGADLTASRLEGALRNTLVWKTGESGDWFKVRLMGKTYQGYIHNSLLVRYRP